MNDSPNKYKSHEEIPLDCGGLMRVYFIDKQMLAEELDEQMKHI